MADQSNKNSYISYRKDFIIDFDVNSISTGGRGEKENEKLQDDLFHKKTRKQGLHNWTFVSFSHIPLTLLSFCMRPTPFTVSRGGRYPPRKSCIMGREQWHFRSNNHVLRVTWYVQSIFNARVTGLP